MHSAGWVAGLEEAVGGKPVLTANQVTLWQALRLVGGRPFQVDESMGSLFGDGDTCADSNADGN